MPSVCPGVIAAPAANSTTGSSLPDLPYRSLWVERLAQASGDVAGEVAGQGTDGLAEVGLVAVTVAVTFTTARPGQCDAYRADCPQIAEIYPVDCGPLDHQLPLALSRPGTRVPHWFATAGLNPVEYLTLFGKQGERVHLTARPTSRTERR